MGQFDLICKNTGRIRTHCGCRECALWRDHVHPGSSDPPRPRKVPRKDGDPPSVYTDYDPPKAITVFCKLHDVPYSSLQYHLHKGFDIMGLGTVEDKLGRKEYRCENCKQYSAKDEEKGCCGHRKTDMTVVRDAICVHYDPNRDKLLTGHPRKKKKKKKKRKGHRRH